jgi:hypothetical protein
MYTGHQHCDCKTFCQTELIPWQITHFSSRPNARQQYVASAAKGQHLVIGYHAVDVGNQLQSAILILLFDRYHIRWIEWATPLDPQCQSRTFAEHVQF